MTLNQMKYFCTAARAQSITKAAQELYVSQPTLTKQLHRIENELGTEIVYRHNRGVVFTPEGEYLAEQAKRIMDVINETKARISVMIENK